MAKNVPRQRNKFHAVNLVEFQTDPLPSARPGWHVAP